MKQLIGLVLLIGAVYGAIEAWPLIAGPALAVASPLNNALAPGGIVDIRGTIRRAAELTLNGTPLLHDQNGAFLSTLTFPKGGSILTLRAIDRFGRTITTTRTIFVP
ncbi:hypothetical protein KGM48_03340 [Patescibacteria group bacterium]|nr:hypothetical protein [Patescibacteria group bacterium]